MYYNKIEFAGNVTWISFGTSQKGNSYVNGYIQAFENADYNGKEYKKNYVSIKFTAFNEQADMINALGIKKGSNLKINGFLKGNVYKNQKTQEEVKETLIIVESVDETFTGQSERQSQNQPNDYDKEFFGRSGGQSKKPYNPDDVDDDLPF